MKKALYCFLVLCLLLGCTTSTEKPKPSTNTIVFVDDADREVEIEQDIERLMPTGALSQIVLFALCPEMFVGLGSRWPESAEGIIDKAYLDLPYFGQLYGSNDINIETLTAASPQLIIDIGEYKESVNDDLDQLSEQTGIPAIFIDARLDNMGDVYRKLGKLLHLEERAEKLADFCERIYFQTEEIMNQVQEEKVNTLYCLGEDGLNVLAKGSYHAQMLDWLTENPAELDNPVSKGLGNTVSLEQILLWNPEVIVFASENAMAKAKEDPAWNELDAFKNNHIYVVPESPYSWMGTPPTVQRFLGMIWLTSLLYPESFHEDALAQIQEYYQLFYHSALSNEQIQELMN